MRGSASTSFQTGLLLIGLLCASACGATPPERSASTTAGTRPATAATQKASADHAPDSVEAWLDRLERQADELASLSARVRMRTIQGLLEDETTRFGEFLYNAPTDTGGDALFAVHFDRIKLDGVVEPIRQSYIYDGLWLLDIDYEAKTATRRELSRPGDDADQLAVGDGPFPVPMNLKKDDVLARFEVSLAEPDEGDPDEPSVHLVLKPRDHVELDAQQIELWFSRETGLPLRASTLQADEDQTVIDLFKLVQGEGRLEAKRFDTALPTGDGWDTQVVPLD